MSEFCEECPLRGDCDGPLVDVLTVSVPRTVLRRLRFVEEYSSVNACIDEDDNISEPFRAEPNADVLDLIDHCQRPQDKTRKYRPHEPYQVCGGLGVESDLNEEEIVYFIREVEEGVGIHAFDDILAETELGRFNKLRKYLIIPAVGSGIATLVGLETNNTDMLIGGISGLGAVAFAVSSILGRLLFTKIPRERDID